MDESTTTDAGTEGLKPAAGDKGSTPATDATGKTFDESYVKTLRQEAATSRKELATVKAALEELQGRDKSESERLSERVTLSERRASEAETKALRYEYAARHGLDFDAAQHITGSTPEEVEASAAHLAEVITARAANVKPAGSFDGGARERPEEKKTPEQAHSDLLLRALGRNT